MLVTLLALIASLLLGPGLHFGATLPEIGPLEAAYGPVSAADCDRWAAPPGRRVQQTEPRPEGGADAGRGSRRGSERRPLRSVPALAQSLRSGETGCLLPGHYRHAEPASLRQPRSRLVGLGRGVRVDGAIWVTERARGAQVRGLDLTASDSSYFIPLKVQANGALVAENRIHGSRSTSCVLVGSTRQAVGVRIERNWIHDCGRRGKLDHLIYLQETSGTIVRGNVLARNPGGWAVHMYPDADRTTIERNLIDGNRGGVIFAGDGDRTSDENVVRWNVIGFSSPRWNIEASWDDAIGQGNIAYSNCLYAAPRGFLGGIGEVVGFGVSDNLVTARSPYAVRAAGRYEFPGESECEKLVEPLPPAFPGH